MAGGGADLPGAGVLLAGAERADLGRTVDGGDESAVCGGDLVEGFAGPRLADQVRQAAAEVVGGGDAGRGDLPQALIDYVARVRSSFGL